MSVRYLAFGPLAATVLAVVYPAENPIAPHHRNVTGGPARAAVFGLSDGLVTNVALVMGVAGGTNGGSVVRLAGLAGLVAGACSMAAGEYVSMKAQTELIERELRMERIELKNRPALETRELSAIYQQRGISAEVADAMATEVMKDPETALAVHAREELGVDPDDLGSPIGASVSSFACFAVGALLPLLPWFFVDGTAAVVASVIIGTAASIALGMVLANFTGRSRLWCAARQLVLSTGAAAITFGVGALIGG